MTSRRRRERRRRVWCRYQDRCDRLARGQGLTTLIQAPIRTTRGYWRAEGWKIDRYKLWWMWK